MSPTTNLVRFASFEMNPCSGELRRHGIKLRVGEQPFRVLSILVQHPGEVVAREELRQRLWPADTFVDFDHGVNAAVKRLREVLDDSADTPRFIETLPRHGYRFICPVESTSPQPTEASKASATPAPSTADARHSWGRPVSYFGLCLLLFALGYGTKSLFLKGRTAIPQASVEFDILPPEGHSLAAEALSRSLAISPDGSHIVFRAKGPDGTRLYLRAMNFVAAKPIPGTKAANDPFFSPDSQWLGFSAGGELRKVAISGGAPVTICWAPGNIGATWSSDENIYFAQPSTSEAWNLMKVPAGGGSPQLLATAGLKKDEVTGIWPQGLPGRKAVLLTAWGGGSDFPRIMAVRTDTGAQQTLVEGGRDAHFVPPGYLVFVRQGQLLAAEFDLGQLKIRGTPRVVLENLEDMSERGFGLFDMSNTGTLTYLSDGLLTFESNLMWRDRGGKSQALVLKPDVYQSPRMAPDGRQMAITIGSPASEIWVYDLERQTMRRMTFSQGENETPVWSPDGQRIAYASNSRKKAFWVLRNGSTGEQPFVEVQRHFHLNSWSADGKLIASEQAEPDDRWEIWMLPWKGKPYAYLQTPFNERTPAFSPDGRWLAYASDETGQFQVYVQRFPGPGEKTIVSSHGGTEPVWARDGKGLYYVNGDRIMQVSVATKPKLAPGKPRQLMTIQPGATSSGPIYDVTPDGKTFVIIENQRAAGPTRIHVVLNWSSELRNRLSSAEH
ncbi:MAG TPA: winged helix-turn-helix domain-containing protein [Terriglobales bacterium]|nr:winged helix-turn-helix domain-containing protein [Terriglobales bacterium]